MTHDDKLIEAKIGAALSPYLNHDAITKAFPERCEGKPFDEEEKIAGEIALCAVLEQYGLPINPNINRGWAKCLDDKWHHLHTNPDGKKYIDGEEYVKVSAVRESENKSLSSRLSQLRTDFRNHFGGIVWTPISHDLGIYKCVVPEKADFLQYVDSHFVEIQKLLEASEHTPPAEGEK